MDHRPSRIVLLATGLTLSAAATVPTPSMAHQAAARADTSADTSRSPVATQSAGWGADPNPVRTLAQRCIDPRHAALVSNALLRGRVFTLAEARGWCDD